MGLAAESLKGYFTQRQRWCRGAIQTLFLKSGPLGPGLTPLQRLLFLPIDWVIQYAARLVAVAVPIVRLWTGLGPFRIPSVEELVGYQLPAIIALAAIFRRLAPSCYVPVFGSAVALFTTLRITPTVLASLIKPFGVPFRVTPKGINNDAGRVDRPVFGAVTILAALTLGGMLFNRLSPNAAGPVRAALVVAEVYALFNLVLLAIAAVLAIEIPNPRHGERFWIKEPGSCRKGPRVPLLDPQYLGIRGPGARPGRSRTGRSDRAEDWPDRHLAGAGRPTIGSRHSRRVRRPLETVAATADRVHLLRGALQSGRMAEIRQRPLRLLQPSVQSIT